MENVQIIYINRYNDIHRTKAEPLALFNTQCPCWEVIEDTHFEHFSPCQSAHDDQDELLAKSNILLASKHFPERYPHRNNSIDWDCQTSENFLAWIWLDSSDFQEGVLYFTLLEYIQV